MELLNKHILYLEGITKQKSEVLNSELGIKTYFDFLMFFPYKYINRNLFYKIYNLPQTNNEIQILVHFVSFKEISQKKGKRLEVLFKDDTGFIKGIWFKKYQWIISMLKPQVTYVLLGKQTVFFQESIFIHPSLQTLDSFKEKNIPSVQPVYTTSEKLIKKGLTNSFFLKFNYQILLELNGKLEETLPYFIVKKYQFVSLYESYYYLHFPKNQNILEKSKNRLKFEELFYLQLQLIQKHTFSKQNIRGFIFSTTGVYFNYFYNKLLSFSFTDAQKRVLKEIRKDLKSGFQMNRLLQGDVGSGKTIIALCACLFAIGNRFQTCIVAPTEILAQQHFNTLLPYFNKLNSSIEILTGSTSQKNAKRILSSLEDGSCNMLIGTHSIFEKRVVFKNLGLSVIDEQHKFGVAQRAQLWKKNSEKIPHILIMTATPIPRTLAMTAYGDLDISVIDELPAGRKTIKTFHYKDSKRLQLNAFLKKEIKKGRQVYIVYPLIEESEKLEYKNLMDGYESLARDFPLPFYKIGMVYGKMTVSDKEKEMQKFIKGETHILISTTVIEVGVNVPNATIMVIESAQKFGLSQLHQLRGRVGRGNDQSYCILMSDYKVSKEANKRLEAMVETTDGFKISEVDLKLRGPGDLMGTKQSGILNLKIASLINDQAILELARKEAINIFKEDPYLNLPKNEIIKKYLKIFSMQRKWGLIS